MFVTTFKKAFVLVFCEYFINYVFVMATDRGGRYKENYFFCFVYATRTII